jgi:hypothetical protein
MPEKGWYSLTIRASTAKSVGEPAKAKGLTVDELLNELITPTKGDERIACRLCEGQNREPIEPHGQNASKIDWQ